MLRFSVALLFLTTILMLSLAGSSTDAIAAPKQCYKEEACMKACFQSGGGNCGLWCERRRKQWPPC